LVKITPLEVHNHQFGVGFRGFDRDEVRAFLALVSEEYEQAISEGTRLKDQMAEMKSRLDESRGREQSLQKAIEAADKIATEMKENARRECELLVKEAQVKAGRVLEQAQTRASGLEDRVNDLKLARDGFEHKLRALLDQYLRALDEAKKEDTEDRIFVLRRPAGA
jgi:cell division initiation protein